MSRAGIAAITLVHDDEGQDLLEYAFLCALIALVCIVAVASVGDTMKTLWWERIADAF